jgi:hypothetical protein
MPKPPTPPDLEHCDDCRKVIGPYRGWFGAECQCGQSLADALRGAHGVGTGITELTSALWVESGHCGAGIAILLTMGRMVN